MIPLSPRARFLANKELAKAHSALMASVQFERAADAAMLQTQLDLPISVNSEGAAANHYRMQGAKYFLLNLLTLGDPIPELPTPPDQSLNYEATKVK